jgi:hypothetical protein
MMPGLTSKTLKEKDMTKETKKKVEHKEQEKFKQGQRKKRERQDGELWMTDTE